VASKARMQAVELAHLPVCAPCGVVGAGAAQVRIGELLEAAFTVERRSTLVSDRFVVHEAVRTRRMDGLFVQAHRVKIPVFDPGNFGADQRSTVCEILRTVLRPDFQLPVVLPQRLQMLLTLGSGYGVAGCGTTKCAIKMIFGSLNVGRCDPEQ